MEKILFIQKGAISQEDKDKLIERDFLIIEAMDVSKIKTISDIQFIGSDIMGKCAIETLNSAYANEQVRVKFAEKLMTEFLKANEKK